MGEINDFIQLYIEDSDMIADKLDEISRELVRNIQGELNIGHGRITGGLHDSINSDPVVRNGLHAIIRAYAMNEYAPYVDDGHDQQPGRFIPGEWNGNRFIYQPNAKTGMVLKKSHVEGLHFMEHGLEKTVAMYR